VTTEFNKWTKNAGQSFPGQIVRRVNDAIVFTFDISGATIGPAQNDGAASTKVERVEIWPGFHASLWRAALTAKFSRS